MLVRCSSYPWSSSVSFCSFNLFHSPFSSSRISFYSFDTFSILKRKCLTIFLHFCMRIFVSSIHSNPSATMQRLMMCKASKAICFQEFYCSKDVCPNVWYDCNAWKRFNPLAKNFLQFFAYIYCRASHWEVSRGQNKIIHFPTGMNEKCSYCHVWQSTKIFSPHVCRQTNVTSSFYWTIIVSEL